MCRTKHSSRQVASRLEESKDLIHWTLVSVENGSFNYTANAEGTRFYRLASDAEMP
ncbi:MAG: hypothetical protein WDM76_18550 [Limisphaerales bacterium]